MLSQACRFFHVKTSDLHFCKPEVFFYTIWFMRV